MPAKKEVLTVDVYFPETEYVKYVENTAMNTFAKITHVAIRFRGEIYSLPAPNRHHHVIRWIVDNVPGVQTVDGDEDDQGFLDEDGVYLRRKPALHRAERTGQIKPGTIIRAGRLFSEDIW